MDIGNSFSNLKGRIDTLKRTLPGDSDIFKIVSNVEAKLGMLDPGAPGADVAQIEKELLCLQETLLLVTEALGPPPEKQRGKIDRFFFYLSQNKSTIGLGALIFAFLTTLIAVGLALYYLGPSSWQTIPGGRAVLLLALTFAFVTFGGALLVTPLFSEGSIEERFRRSREVFLLFSGMFTTVVGFYFASANNAFLGSSILVAQLFNAPKGELEVAVAGGKPPYVIEVEFGEKGTVKKKPPQSLETAGTVKFQFNKASEWPKPMTIRAKDSSDAKTERAVALDSEELRANDFTEPKKDQPTTAVSVTPTLALVDPEFDTAAGTIEIKVQGGKPPYIVKAIYGDDNRTALMSAVPGDTGKMKYLFKKDKDWPLPLRILATDADRKSIKQEVKVVNEEKLLQGNFKKPGPPS